MTSQDPDLPAPLEEALRRLGAALGRLEAATVRRAAHHRARGDLEEELRVMQDDRARLAADLDGALARNRTLQLTLTDVAGRVERAERLVREVVEGDAQGPQS